MKVFPLHISFQTKFNRNECETSIKKLGIIGIPGRKLILLTFCLGLSLI